MKKLLLMVLLSLTLLSANTYDTYYTCIAFQKNHGSQAERLDMRESLAKGGNFSFSVKINFLDAIVSPNKDTINNIEYDDIRFAFRYTVKGYDMYIYNYNKAYFLIKKANKINPRLNMKLENGDRLYYQCKMYEGV